jgi:pimeloyl-ACP methyl ester carboxylesterase
MAQTAPAAGRQKSTIDRTLDTLRTVFKPLARVSPRLAGRAAERLFFTPGRPKSGPVDPVWQTGRPLPLAVAGRRVAAWRWGRGPVVVLLHGWNGRASQLSSFVAPLVGQGFSVVALDAPGHGASGRERSSAPQFAAAVQAVVAATGPVVGIVAHSLGAAGATLAVADGAAVGRLVLVAPAADPPAWIPPFAARLGLTPAATEHLRAISERRLGRSWDDLHVPTLVGRLAKPVLVIHDRDDREVAWSEGAKVAAAAPGSEFLTTTGLGHVRLLREPSVVSAAVEFLFRDTHRCGGCGTPTLAGAPYCRRCGLEQDLFDPATRWIDRGLSSEPTSPTPE